MVEQIEHSPCDTITNINNVLYQIQESSDTFELEDIPTIATAIPQQDYKLHTDYSLIQRIRADFGFQIQSMEDVSSFVKQNGALIDNGANVQGIMPRDKLHLLTDVKSKHSTLIGISAQDTDSIGILNANIYVE